MTAIDTTPATRGRGLTITLWTLQILLGVFFIVASAGPKLFGEAYAVQIFEDIGAGAWLRYVVGVLELAGGIGLLIPRLAGAAAAGLAALMVFAALTQAFILDGGVLVLTPLVLFVAFAFIAWARRSETAALRRALRS